MSTKFLTMPIENKNNEQTNKKMRNLKVQDSTIALDLKKNQLIIENIQKNEDSDSIYSFDADLEEDLSSEEEEQVTY